jgi:hypothetical protein
MPGGRHSKGTNTKMAGSSLPRSDLKVSRRVPSKRRDVRSGGFRSVAVYDERMTARLKGDRAQMVSPAFEAAVDALGKREVDVAALSAAERAKLAGIDLRWQPGPDGVLLWTPAASARNRPQSALDFSWLAKASEEVLHQLKSETRSKKASACDSPWLEIWVRAWASWGHRFMSVQYDRALSAAKTKVSSQRPTYAASVVRPLLRSLRVLLLEYLPHSRAQKRGSSQESAQVDGWLMPEELLDEANHALMGNTYRDDFWGQCCQKFKKEEKSKTRVQHRNGAGSKISTDVQSFLDFVAWSLNRQGQTHSTTPTATRFSCPFLPRSAFSNLLIPVAETACHRDSALGSSWMETRYQVPLARSADKSCSWISRDYPHLSGWEPFAREYVLNLKKNIPRALDGLSLFIDRYLANAGRPGTPGEKLDPKLAMRPIADGVSSDGLLLVTNRNRVPTTIDQLGGGSSLFRVIRDGFIPHILDHHCSLIDREHIQLLADYCNPFAGMSEKKKSGATSLGTLRPALPYRWIRRLRSILAQGPHFCDWNWAQHAQQREAGPGADWFEVDEAVIDRADPDCVWRQRSTGSVKNGNRRTFFEIWSPARWVVLLIKLNTALRTTQVRVLDSGESDGWRFDLRQWAAQSYPGPDGQAEQTKKKSDANAGQSLVGALGSAWMINDIEARNPDLFASIAPAEALRKKGGKRDPKGWANGALRAVPALGHVAGINTVIYANTNKTADAKKEGAAKGFEIPLPLNTCPLPPDPCFWVRQADHQPSLRPTFSSPRQERDWLDELGENTHWFLAKLRDWQEKYNPIDRRVEWKELSKTGLITEKSDEQYEMYRPACFLFREPAVHNSRRHPGRVYPLPSSVVGGAWWTLLKELQDRLNAERADDAPEYRLVLDDNGYTAACEYDLHSIRVSIITALIVDGKVPIEIVQRMVGHSRLVMTIYYTKLNPLNMAQEIGAGFKRARDTEVEAEKTFLRNASVAELRARAAFNDVDSALKALGASRPPAERNVVMWMRKLGGICPVGGVSHNTEGCLPAGCFNGGALISGAKGAKYSEYGPVEGGPGNCVNCHWFVSLLAHVGELQAIADASNYRWYEFSERAAQQSKQIDRTRAEWDRREVENGGLTAAERVQFNHELDAAEAVRDGYLESAAIDLITAANSYKLISRFAQIERESAGQSENALVANGSEDELKIVLSETTSAMLHAARVSLHAELHPEINAPSASLRSALILARKLQEEDIDPFRLLGLPEDMQARAVNAVMRHTAALFDPNNLEIGLSAAAALIESDQRLSHVAGIRKERLEDWIDACSKGNADIASLQPTHGLASISQD